MNEIVPTQRSLPPVLLGSVTPENRERVENFFFSVASIFEAWVMFNNLRCLLAMKRQRLPELPIGMTDSSVFDSSRLRKYAKYRSVNRANKSRATTEKLTGVPSRASSR